jgi:chemotaxis protein methyltransferase CheR
VAISVREDEVDLLLEDVQTLYGYDFSDYTKASLFRRINRLISLDSFPSFAEFRYKVRTDAGYLKRFVEEITVNVTEMFRDPGFYAALRAQVLPIIASRPFIRIWHAGCSTGEEVYSMAILLQEAGLLHKSLLYATDINPDVIERARKAIFPLSRLKEYSENYIAAGGRADFSQYYTAKYDRVLFQEKLREQMIFATHNLVSDRSFNEFQLILCRNVLIYFDKELQNKVFHLFDASLEPLGFLALGAKETIRFSGLGNAYKQIGKEKIWRKSKQV